MQERVHRRNRDTTEQQNELTQKSDEQPTIQDPQCIQTSQLLWK